MADWDAELDELRWHWGSAYMVYRVAPDHWIALRKDNYDCLRAASPELLNGMMRSDYHARPVPR